MPGCGGSNVGQQDDPVEMDDWREPPGYLGEAVRRAKLLARTLRAMQQAQALDCPSD